MTARLLVAGFAVAAALASTAAAEPAPDRHNRLAVAPDEITLAVRPSITRWGERVAIFGTVANRRADQKVTVQFKGCGLHPREFRDAAETTTREGDAWSVDWLFGRGTGVYRAVWGDAVSLAVNVQGRPSVRLSETTTGDWPSLSQPRCRSPRSGFSSSASTGLGNG